MFCHVKRKLNVAKRFKIEIKNVSKTFGELVKNMPILKKNLTQHMWVCHRDCRFLNFDDPRILWSFYIQVHSPLQIFSLLQINALQIQRVEEQLSPMSNDVVKGQVLNPNFFEWQYYVMVKNVIQNLWPFIIICVPNFS